MTYFNILFVDVQVWGSIWIESGIVKYKHSMKSTVEVVQRIYFEIMKMNTMQNLLWHV